MYKAYIKSLVMITKVNNFQKLMKIIIMKLEKYVCMQYIQGCHVHICDLPKQKPT